MPQRQKGASVTRRPSGSKTVHEIFCIQSRHPCTPVPEAANVEAQRTGSLARIGRNHWSGSGHQVRNPPAFKGVLTKLAVWTSITMPAIGR
jgi:hypothetical protein